ncbi:hypothetical protein [Rhodococcoides kyotonense]|uniref:Uncharacterized protein n=1 Tax=Rhodococcoides kyotonense TaxID=398843 RepID=A0A239FMY0_9NOCA|nr:hypothetical protein [Rhodococcus kyotonensis]SNS58286.1 hypothetical protein SAMN05421642_103380 [Rhodococcus kyotonensis]
MPNKPKTTLRNFRIPDDEYAAAKAAAEANGESLTDVVRRALSGYAKRTEKKQRQTGA